jgi:peptide deformylase
MKEFYIECDDFKLKETCTLIDHSDKELITQIYNSLKNTLHWLGGGAGLAAPQISILKQAFIWTKNRDMNNIKLALNPSIEPYTELGMIESLEGCFSIPQKFFHVPRYKKIYFQYFDINGKEVSRIVEGSEAVVLQHEYDHLQKKLLSDKGKIFKTFDSSKEYKEFLENYRKISNHG